MKIITLFILTALLFFHNIIFAQSGTLKLDPTNPHYFWYKGKAMILVGSGEHYGAVINTAFNYKTYLRTIANDSLNITRVFTGAYIEKPGDFGIKKNTLAPNDAHLILPWKRSGIAGFNLGGNKFDLKQWDDTYFNRLKKFIAGAEKNNVIVEINLFSAYYENGWKYSPLNPANNINHLDMINSLFVNTMNNGNIMLYQEKYVKKIVCELNAFPNLYYEIENEPYITLEDTVSIQRELKNNPELFAKSSALWQHKVAGWIKEEESKLRNKHLVSQNIANTKHRITNPDPAISIFNFHYAVTDAVKENYHLNKVIGCNETGFNGSGNEIYLKQAWRFLMTGGGLFNNLDYSFSPGTETGQDTLYTAPGGGSPVLRRQLGILKRFLDNYNITKLKPDNSVAAPKGETVESLSNNEALWLIYFEKNTSKPYTIKLNIPKGIIFKVFWMDIKTGKTSPCYNVDNRRITTPYDMENRVIIVKAVSKRNLIKNPKLKIQN